MPHEVPNTVVVRAPATGWVLGDRYRVGERLGCGGTADVFRAHDDLLDRDVAVKVFRVPPADHEAVFTAARRDAELQSLARLNHPNLIRLLDGSVGADGPAYLVLDLICGPDLATRLHDGPLPDDEVRLIGRQIASALGYAHEHGMVHRDVKPANILLGNDGPDGTVWARLSDFGTVRMIDSARLTAACLTLGTAAYLAPEQAQGADVGPAADVYSLGLVMIEALTGERCYAGSTGETLAARLVRPPTIPKWVPADLITLLTAMTAIDPDRRPTAATVAETLTAPAAVLVAAVDEALTAPVLPIVETPSGELAPVDDVAAPIVIPPPARMRPARRSNTLFALAGIAFAALLAGAAFLLFGNSSGSGDGTPVEIQRSTGPQHPAHRSHTQDANAQVGQRSGPTARQVAPVHTSAARTSGRQQGVLPARQSASQAQPTQSSSSAAPTSSSAPSTSTEPTPTTSAPPATSEAATTSAAPSAPPPPSP